MTPSGILAVVLVPAAVALVAVLQQVLLLSQSRTPEATRNAMACDVYQVSWTSGALGLAMFGIAAFFIKVLVWFSKPEQLVFFGFCGLSALFIGLGVHSIWLIFRASVHFLKDRIELRKGRRVQSVRYDELTSVSVASWHIVCASSAGKPFRIPTIFKGNALILARLHSIIEGKRQSQQL